MIERFFLKFLLNQNTIVVQIDGEQLHDKVLVLLLSIYFLFEILICYYNFFALISTTHDQLMSRVKIK